MIRFVYIEVEANPNCAALDPMRYRELGPPSVIMRVRIFDRREEGEWCAIAGVGKSSDERWGPAYVRKVEDSGVGVAYLIYGGIWGIRLCPLDRARSWSFEEPDQWGEPYLLLTDAGDVVTADADGGP